MIIKQRCSLKSHKSSVKHRAKLLHCFRFIKQTKNKPGNTFISFPALINNLNLNPQIMFEWNSILTCDCGAVNSANTCLDWADVISVSVFSHSSALLIEGRRGNMLMRADTHFCMIIAGQTHVWLPRRFWRSSSSSSLRLRKQLVACFNSFSSFKSFSFSLESGGFSTL